MVVLGVVVAAVAAFVASSVYYSVLSPVERRRVGAAAIDRGRPTPIKVVVELVRTAMVAAVFAFVASRADLMSFPHALLLAVLLWVGFPLVLLTGSALWERVPVPTAVLHLGDWLLKLLIIGAAVAVLN